MPRFQSKRRVRHDAQKMFDLVADVEAYPKFVPLCQGLRVRRRFLENDQEILVANMEVGFMKVRESFTSRVTLDRPNMRIETRYIDGPFSRLKNIWDFRDPPGSNQTESEVTFFIDYEFKSRTLGMLMGSMFDSAFRKFSIAFEQRADEVYGRARV